MKKEPGFSWQPISKLPIVTTAIDGVFQNTEEQYQTLLEAQKKPWVLDDALVKRIVKLYTVQLDDLDCYEEQLNRWQKETLTTDHQRKEIFRLEHQVSSAKALSKAILVIADEIKSNTIDKIIERDDAQLALDILSGKLPFTGDMPRQEPQWKSSPILPPEITSSKSHSSDGWIYTFRHKELGELGRIRMKEVEAGQTYIMCEGVGDPDDPMTKKRLAVFEPIARQLTDAMEQRLGKGSTSKSPPPPKPTGRVVQSKLVQCDQCEAPIAMLVFAEGNDSLGMLEDYFRMMYGEIKKHNLPTWIIGPQKEDSPDCPVNSLKVWPVREPLQRMSANEFNPLLEKLECPHCGH